MAVLHFTVSKQFQVLFFLYKQSASSNYTQTVSPHQQPTQLHRRFCRIPADFWRSQLGSPDPATQALRFSVFTSSAVSLAPPSRRLSCPLPGGGGGGGGGLLGQLARAAAVGNNQWGACTSTSRWEEEESARLHLLWRSQSEREADAALFARR